MKMRYDFMGIIEQIGWMADSACTKSGTVFMGGNNRDRAVLNV